MFPIPEPSDWRRRRWIHPDPPAGQNTSGHSAGRQKSWFPVLGGVSVPQATSALTSGQPSFEQWKARQGRGRSQGALPFSHGRNVGAGRTANPMDDASGVPSFEQWRRKHSANSFGKYQAAGFRMPDDNRLQRDFGHWVAQPMHGKRSARPGGRADDQGPFVDPATVPGTKPWFLAQAKKKKWPPQDKRDGQRRGFGQSGLSPANKGRNKPFPAGKDPHGGRGDGAGPGWGLGGGQGSGMQSMGWRAPTAEQLARLAASGDPWKILW
tara:strand:- start:3083 stop:3883 length:801 start_codon:yes stop_codon:yes gene_type:complete